jgi:hypothetical protein
MATKRHIPRTYRIEIRLERGPSLSYWLDGGVAAWTLRVRGRDNIVWQCRHPFGIRFGDPSPMSEYFLDAMGGPEVYTRRATVRGEAHAGPRKYTVAVNAAGGAPPLIDDPEIIIEPEAC